MVRWDFVVSNQDNTLKSFTIAYNFLKVLKLLSDFFLKMNKLIAGIGKII